MNRLKRWFITPYLLATAAASAAAFLLPWFGQALWLTLLASAGPAAWLTVVHTLKPTRARTPRRYPSLVVLAVAGTAASALAWPDLGPLAANLVLTAGLVLYLYWYSEYGVTKSSYLSVGGRLPEFSAWEGGTAVTSRSLKGTPALLLFYRGNWCPVCTAQIDELAAQYDQLSSRGIAVVLISPQSDQHSQDVARRVKLPFRFWEDRDNSAAQKLNIVDPAGLPLGMELLGYGSDTPVPTAVLVDGESTIVYSDQSENYRLRPEPGEYLKAWDEARRR